MLKLFFLFVICLFGGAWLFQLAAATPGYLLLVVGNTSIEVNIWFALAVVAAIIIISWLIYKLLHGSIHGVGTHMGRVFIGSEKRAQRQMSRGFIHFFEGNWKQALRLLNKSAEQSPAPLLNYLGAARSAYELGEVQAANELLLKAEQEAPDAALSVILSQARMQFVAKKYEQCAATLERGKKLAPKNPVVLDLLSQVYAQLHDWKSLESILPLMNQHALIKTVELEKISATVYQRLLEQAGQSGKLEPVNQCWQKIPRQWQQSPEVLLIYIDLLDQLAEQDQAELILRKALQKDWDNRLILRYGLLQSSDVKRQLLKAEGWLKERPGNGDLLLSLGRLSLRNKLWGKAKDYFSSSLKLQPSPAAYAEMARLLASLGEHQKSTEYYQNGLLMAASKLPELPLPEDQ